MQQLGTLVRFHKALADVTRLRIIGLLSIGPLHGQAIAGKLGLTPATVTFHMTKLRDAGIVTDKRVKNTVYFNLNLSALEADAMQIINFIQHLSAREESNMKDEGQVVRNFITPEGRLKSIPAQLKKRLYVFNWMVRGLEVGRKYQEKEINEYISRYHDDFATIRREFIMHQYMYRDNGIYELNPREFWPRPQDL